MIQPCRNRLMILIVSCASTTGFAGGAHAADSAPADTRPKVDAAAFAEADAEAVAITPAVADARHPRRTAPLPLSVSTRTAGEAFICTLRQDTRRVIVHFSPAEPTQSLNLVVAPSAAPLHEPTPETFDRLGQTNSFDRGGTVSMITPTHFDRG